MTEFRQSVSLGHRVHDFFLCFGGLSFSLGDSILLASCRCTLEGSPVGFEGEVGSLIFPIGGRPIVVFLVLFDRTIFRRLGSALSSVFDCALQYVSNQYKVRLYLGFFVGPHHFDVWTKRIKSSRQRISELACKINCILAGSPITEGDADRQLGAKLMDRSRESHLVAHSSRCGTVVSQRLFQVGPPHVSASSL